MENEQTAFQKFKIYLDHDANLGLVDKKTANRLKWYIDSYFLLLERQIIIDAGNKCQIYNDGFIYKDGEQYYNETYGSQAPQRLKEANGKE